MGLLRACCSLLLAASATAELDVLAMVQNGVVTRRLSPEEAPAARDAAEVQLHATQSANLEMQHMAMAKERLQKAVQAVQKSKRRIQVLQKENATSVAKHAKAHSQRMEMTNKAISFRLKQAERESLKGKHLKFDKKTYMQRVKNGNFSTYGLWTTYNTKQHFGEKTWDILSNHIFGLDKLMKHLFNATDSERKAKAFLKLERQYDAMGAAAQEEILEQETQIEAAEVEMTAAKAALQQAAEAKAVQLAMKREARKQLAKERAVAASERASLLRKQRLARKEEEAAGQAEASAGQAEAESEAEASGLVAEEASQNSTASEPLAAAEEAPVEEASAAAQAEGKDAAEQEVQAIIEEAKNAEAKEAAEAPEAPEQSPEMTELDAEMAALEAEEKLMGQGAPEAAAAGRPDAAGSLSGTGA